MQPQQQPQQQPQMQPLTLEYLRNNIQEYLDKNYKPPQKMKSGNTFSFYLDTFLYCTIVFFSLVAGNVFGHIGAGLYCVLLILGVYTSYIQKQKKLDTLTKAYINYNEMFIKNHGKIIGKKMLNKWKADLDQK